MNKKPIIGIIGYIEKTKNLVTESILTEITVEEYLRESIVLSGGIPILIMPTQQLRYNPDTRPGSINRLTSVEKEDLDRQIDLCDGILIPGGSEWYEHHEYIFKSALEKNKSILGLCLGMQIMVGTISRKYHEGKYQNTKIETEINHKKAPSTEYAHDVKIVDNTILKNILGTNEIKVNSKHSYHVNNVEEFIISSYSPDGVPESVEMPNKKFVVGIQWHPEKLIETDIYSKKIFEAFINSCK